MTILREGSDVRERSAFDSAYKQAFGLSLERSAEDRALRAELAALAATGDFGPIEAQARMNAALAIGDSMQARALAHLAFERRNDELGGQAWIGVCESYGGSAPAVDRLMSAVFVAGAIPHRRDQFMDKTATEIQVPSDLVGPLEALAADDESAGPVGASFAG